MGASDMLFRTTNWIRTPGTTEPLTENLAAGVRDPSLFASTEPTNFIKTMGWRGMRIRAIGDADGETTALVVFGIDVDNFFKPTTWTAMELGTATFTTGTLAGLGTGSHFVNLIDLHCDTVTWAGTAAGNALFSYANGAAITNSLGVANGIAELMLPDLGNLYGIVLAHEDGTDGGLFGSLYKLDR